MNKEQTKSLALLSLPFLLALIITAVLQYTILAKPELVQSWLESFGSWIILAYVLIQTITIVVPPLGALFAQLAVLSIFGPLKGVVLIYLVSTPAYCINFFLARRYGRPLVEKVIGKQGMAKMDNVFADAGVGTLVILKVLQGGYFDFVSYAAGLSKITWTEFLLVNIFGGIPYAILTYIVFLKSNNLIKSVIILQGLAIVLIAMSFLINHYKNKNKKSPQS